MRPSLAAAPAVAAFAAVAAHALIDRLGDVVLAHDAYDDLGHGSRPLVLVAGTVAALVFVALVVLLARRQARAHGAPLRAFLRAVAPRRPLRFAATVALLAPLGVAAMGALDVLLAGRSVDDLGDLLAGAPFFAIVVAALCGACAGVAAGFGLRALARRERALVAMLGPQRRTLVRLGARPPHAFAREHVPVVRAPRLVRRRAGRAPPSSLR